MKWKLLAVLALCGAFLVPMFNPSKAYACSCFKGTAEDSFHNSEAVFTGKIVGVRDEKRPNTDGGSFIAHIYTIAVGKSWKGISSSQMEAVFQSDYRSAEGFEITPPCEVSGLTLEQTYLLYSSRNPSTGEYLASTSPCSRTVLLSDAAADLQELGPGSVIEALDKPGMFEQYWWLGAGIVVIIVGALVLWKRWRPPSEAVL